MSRRKSQVPSPIPQRGEVWIANQNPAIPNDPHLPRPVVIVSTNSRNRVLQNVIIVPFSAGLKQPHKPFHKLVSKGSGGLPQDCHARCDLVSTLAKAYLDPRGPLGPPLSDEALREIAEGVRAAIGDSLL